MSVQAPNLNNATEMAAKMCNQAIMALGKLINGEIATSKSMIEKGESFPEGTVRFSCIEKNSNTLVNGAIRAKYLYEKAVIKNVDELIQKLGNAKKIVFDIVLNYTASGIENLDEIFQSCLAACDPSIKAQGMTSSPLVRSVVYYIVSKS
jgi:hypothetical protein